MTVNNVSPISGEEIFRPAPGRGGDNNFDMMKFGGYSNQLGSSFSITPTAAHKVGQHTVTIRVGASYMVRHSSIEEHSTTFENNYNCGTNAPCYIEMTHTFSCKPPLACNEECGSSIECRGNAQGCTECRDDGAGKKTCQPPPACNAQCATNEDCSSNLAGCTTCRPDPTGQKTCQPAPPRNVMLPVAPTVNVLVD